MMSEEKNPPKINIWSTQLFCTPLNVNEAEALITAATVDKHDTLSTHPQREEGRKTRALKKEKERGRQMVFRD